MITAASELVRKVAGALQHSSRINPDSWSGVPASVAYRIHLLTPLAVKCAEASDCNVAIANVGTMQVQVVDGSSDSLLRFGVPAYESSTLPRDIDQWSIVKFASPGIFSPVANALSKAQRVIGGPSPLTASLVGSAIVGGLGYGAGSLIDTLAPDDYFDQGMGWRMGLAGAGIGALPGLYWGYKGRSVDPRNPQRTFTDLGAGFTKSYPFHTPQEKSGAATNPMFLPTIPVDAFNRTVWNDVRNPGNLFGARSAWGDNTQSLGTPPGVAAMVTGMLEGTKVMQGSGNVSPWSVAVSSAVGAGAGLVGGTLFGKTLGALAGLNSDTQKKLQQTGVWGGLLTGAAKALF